MHQLSLFWRRDVYFLELQFSWYFLCQFDKNVSGLWLPLPELKCVHSRYFIPLSLFCKIHIIMQFVDIITSIPLKEPTWCGESGRKTQYLITFKTFLLYFPPELLTTPIQYIFSMKLNILKEFNKIKLDTVHA